MKRLAPLLIGGVLLVTLVAVFASDGNLAAAAGPVLGVALLWIIWRAPVRLTLIAMIGVGLFFDHPAEQPFLGEWKPPWQVVGDLFYANLYDYLKLPVLRFSGSEFLVAYLLGIVAYRRATRSKVDPPSLPSPRPLRLLVWLSFATLLWLEVWGIARGGDFKESIWQFRILLLAPPLCFLCQYALELRRDGRLLARIVVAAALWKVVLGAYFIWVMVPRLGIEEPPYATTHSDTMLYVAAVMILICRWWESPTRAHLVRAALLLPVLGLGMVQNDRRLVYVSIAAAVACVYLVSPWNRAKKFLTRAVVYGLPLILVYVAVGWNARGGAFKPVQTFKSMIVSDDSTEESASTEFRDLENYNLIESWKQNPILGSGFGHEYLEINVMPDISAAMPNYRYLPHNTVLWMWMNGGWVGFTALWAYLAAVCFFAARAYHRAVEPLDRTAMLVTFSVVIAYLNQAYGDMGTQASMGLFLLAPVVAFSGQLAVRVGAWRGHGRAEVVPPLTVVPGTASTELPALHRQTVSSPSPPRAQHP